MKWMSTDQRDEWNAILDEALDDTSATTYPQRAGLVLANLRDAQQAHRQWAHKVIEDAILTGLARALKARSDSRDRVLVALPRGRQAERKARRGVRSKADDGTVIHQQKLIHDLTWDEALALVDGLTRQIVSLSDSRAMLGRLTKLRDAAPNSTGPGDAARTLGTTLDEFLASAA